jgi:tetratricopeptide (TPR) repeat protein
LNRGSIIEGKDPKSALASYRKAIELDPKQITAYVCLAELARRMGDRRTAVVNLGRALELDPNNDLALNELAWDYALGNEKLQQALALSKRSLQLKPEEATYWDTLAEIYLRLGQLSEAKAANDKALIHARDQSVIQSVEERAQKIETRTNRSTAQPR